MNNRLYTGGTFDMFHFGHVRFLKMCAQLGDVTVALNEKDINAGNDPQLDKALELINKQ